MASSHSTAPKKTRRKKLRTIDQAVPASGQHKKPCSDCPWRRDALRGWLGGASVEDWLQEAHGEAYIDCHVLKEQQCAGAAIYRANVSKLPRARDILVLPRDATAVFAAPTEFAEHHRGTAGK